MALIAEEVVEEWLNQQGYFTIRGVRLGRDEMDILAVKITKGQFDLRHYEVQASVNPVSYISHSNAKQMSKDELAVSVEQWIDKKFRMKKKEDLRNSLFAGAWAFYLVVHKVRHPEEIDVIKEKRIKVARLENVLEDLKKKKKGHFTASGKDLVDLMLMSRA